MLLADAIKEVKNGIKQKKTHVLHSSPWPRTRSQSNGDHAFVLPSIPHDHHQFPQGLMGLGKSQRRLKRPARAPS